jgi:biotin carboxyl carrier protein
LRPEINHSAERNDKLLTLEAMKKQSKIYAAIASRVNKVLVTIAP